MIDTKTGQPIVYVCPSCGNRTRGLTNARCERCMTKDWDVQFSDQAEAKMAEDPALAEAIREMTARMRQVIAEFEAGRFATIDEALMSIGMEKHLIEDDDGSAEV